MTKEQIIEILAKVGANVYIPYDVKCNIADAILALPIETPTYELVDTGIEMPSDEEIKKASTSEVVRHPATKDEKIAFIAGTKWIKDEIIRRNK